MLVTLEGIDGSGKSTVWEAIQGRYPDAVFTHEPTDSWYGDAVSRSIADESADPLAELFLYTADHADHLTRVIRPALDADRLVVSDRFADSRYAYQGATLRDIIDRPLEYVYEIHRPITIRPNLTFYFDLDPEIAVERAGGTNKFERVEYLRRVKRNYERLIEDEPDRFVRIDATNEPDTVVETVERKLDRLIMDR